MATPRQDFALIGNFAVDCTVSESHEWESEISEYPAEGGSAISDNILPRPIVVTLDGIVSDTPIGPVLAYRGLSAGQQPDVDGGDRISEDAYIVFQAIRDKREPVSIITSLQQYESMALKHLTIPRSPSDGESLRFSATFVQIVIRENTRSARVAIPAAKGTRVVTKPPVPAAKASGGSFNDSLPTYKVIRAFEQSHGTDYYWYDNAIGGWRLSAVHDIPTKGGTPNAVALGAFSPALGVLASNDGVATDGWVVYKERPFGASHEEYALHSDDAYWAAKISAASGNDRGSDFDPWNTGIGNPDSAVTDIRVVHAMRR